ncbi:hypothetical protein CC1G_08900 [Coprinopsis cinerea okayama7|uniref:Uncharacterized protein n=1 Tax=Coprinopsis cinerea (strain Okayama-7 / 130 / ATCC MYA-4618 / FGSC 9003) TaxID=240176 RepID=A8P892_COPC7|nr:hypothetical protein CC1G_08900 [Coprinopsis cinerea okayama7\|eukprot:XP_001839521.2 hypothetical protein CC1G_08900 [Coprinopsis cinerea okayama7\
MPPRKKNVHPNTLANLKVGRKRRTEIEAPDQEKSDVSIPQENQSSSSGVESSTDQPLHVEVLPTSGPVTTGGKEKRKSAAVASAEVEGPDDDEWMPPKKKRDLERNKSQRKERPDKYATGPDISVKAPRTQRRYKAAWATQTTLDGFLSSKQTATSEETGAVSEDEDCPSVVC